MAGARSTAVPDAEALAEFADALRQLRREAGNPGYRVLARRTGYGTTTLWEATSGRTVPTLAVTLAYVAACGGDTAEWERRWQQLMEPGDPGPGKPPPGPEPIRPHQLPFDVYGFTGRSGELSRLDTLLNEAAEGAAPAVVISTVSGTAGVGKTALAVHWAHRVAERFPDGELYLDMRGYDPDQPVQPADALAASLRTLGLAGNDIPEEVAERAARYRTLLAKRRMLVVLDNVYGVEQVRPLLPGTGTCFVVVTSRDSLAGLVVRHGARRIDLDLLSSSEALALLHKLVGERVDAEPEAAAAMVERCARLPLALRIAAELIASRPAVPLDRLVSELADERGRLDRLEVATDDRSAVRAVFSWSYQRLPASAARAFRMFGLFPGTDIDRYAMAAMLGMDLSSSRQAVDVLVRAHLAQESRPGRYGTHDLLRAYAAERAGEEEPDPDQRAALTRLLHYYHFTVDTAVGLLFPAEQQNRSRPPAPTGPTPDLDSAKSAQAWLDNERPNLVEAVGYAAKHGSPTQTSYLTRLLWRYLDLGAHYGDARTVYEHALRAAIDNEDRLGEALALQGLGHAFYRFGRYEEAANHYRQAAQIFVAVSDRDRQNIALANLGMVYTQWGRYSDALPCYEQAITVARELGNRAEESLALAWAGLELGRLARYDEGIENLRQALVYFRSVNFPMREAEVLTDLGMVHLWAGHHHEAHTFLQEALAIGQRTSDRNREAEALNGVAEVLHATGRLDEALANHRSALALARDIGQRDEQARAADGIAGIMSARGRLDEARRYWREAIDLYTALKMPQADKIRERLTH
jgi:tetratricopeptide (TPR) repeat protein